MKLSDVTLEEHWAGHLILRNQKSQLDKSIAILSREPARSCVRTLRERVDEQHPENRWLFPAFNSLDSQPIASDGRTHGDGFDRGAGLFGSEPNVGIYDELVGHQTSIPKRP